MFTFLFCLYLFSFLFCSLFDKKRPLLERVEMVQKHQNTLSKYLKSPTPLQCACMYELKTFDTKLPCEWLYWFQPDYNGTQRSPCWQLASTMNQELTRHCPKAATGMWLQDPCTQATLCIIVLWVLGCLCVVFWWLAFGFFVSVWFFCLFVCFLKRRLWICISYAEWINLITWEIK